MALATAQSSSVGCWPRCRCTSGTVFHDGPSTCGMWVARSPPIQDRHDRRSALAATLDGTLQGLRELLRRAELLADAHRDQAGGGRVVRAIPGARNSQPKKVTLPRTTKPTARITSAKPMRLAQAGTFEWLRPDGALRQPDRQRVAVDPHLDVVVERHDHHPVSLGAPRLDGDQRPRLLALADQHARGCRPRWSAAAAFETAIRRRAETEPAYPPSRRAYRPVARSGAQRSRAGASAGDRLGVDRVQDQLDVRRRPPPRRRAGSPPASRDRWGSAHIGSLQVAQRPALGAREGDQQRERALDLRGIAAGCAARGIDLVAQRPVALDACCRTR